MSGLLRKTYLDSDLISTVFHFSEVGSTNNIAKKMILKEKEGGFAVISDIQTAGYGRRGDFWESPKGGLWCSLAIKPDINPSIIGLIPIICALSVSKALESHDIKTRLKWPNDILHSRDEAKIAGIIVEGKVSSKMVEYIIIGIGINVNIELEQFSPPLRNHITSTLKIKRTKISLEELLHTIIFYLEEGFDKMKKGEENHILSQWKQRDNILGRKIVITSNNIEYEGIAKDLTLYGQMILELVDGRKITFSSGNVKLL